jgi:tRNA acetyltransferase TAN1
LSAGDYDFNVIVSCPWGGYAKARTEIAKILAHIGDNQPKVKVTLARGIIGVKTSVKPRRVIQALHALFEKDPSVVQHALKWVPIDLWTDSDIESIKKGIATLSGNIEPTETWRMTVEMRRYTAMQKIDLIREAAELIDQKVDLENPDKIVRIDIIGGHAGISVLEPEEIFSVVKARSRALILN